MPEAASQLSGLIASMRRESSRRLTNERRRLENEKQLIKNSSKLLLVLAGVAGFVGFAVVLKIMTLATKYLHLNRGLGDILVMIAVFFIAPAVFALVFSVGRHFQVGLPLKRIKERKEWVARLQEGTPCVTYRDGVLSIDANDSG